MTRWILGDIARVEIIRPGMPLHRWMETQGARPDILFNASLYTAGGTPCGTIFSGGRLVSDQGKGFGFGTVDGKTILFGGPWDRSWRDYLTGYYGLVQDGRAVPRPWEDKYVFDQKLKRIAFGQGKDGRYGVLCADGKTAEELAALGVREGFASLCNLDGGGSRALFWKGQWIYRSSRTPYNAVAIWLKKDTEDGDGMTVKCTRKTAVYTAAGKLQSGRYIDAGDICTLGKTIEEAGLCLRVEYPTASGRRTAYVKDLGSFARV